MAAITDVTYCHEHPAESFGVNVKGTQNMLELARKCNSKFVYVSTSHVYGVPKMLPIDENHPRNPNSIYASTKLAGEIISESYAKSYGIDISIIRPFSAYGPGSPPHLVTSKIIFQILNDRTIQVGNLYPKRDFVYIQDVVNAIEIISRETRGFNVYNVGSGKSYSILDICNMLKKIGGVKHQIKSIKSQIRKNDIDNIVSDSNKIRKLGWKPQTGILDGLRETLEWFVTKNR